MQAELLGIPVLRPSMLDCTALGAAILGKYFVTSNRIFLKSFQGNPIGHVTFF